MRAHLLAACTLTLLCVRAHADSAPVWLQVTTPHFTVVTDANEKQARNIAAQFERMQAVFSTILPAAHSGPDAQIVVLALRNKRDFQAIEPAEYLAKDKLDLSGLFIQSDERCYILVRLDANGDHPYSTIYHEYTHYITRHAHLPLWLNEGIAEFYENTDIDSHETHFGQPDLIDLNLLRSQSLLPLPMLFTVDHASPYYHEQHKAKIFYAESWALTYMLYMNDLRNKTSLISDYLSALSAGQDSLTAAVTAFGDLGKLEARSPQKSATASSPLSLCPPRSPSTSPPTKPLHWPPPTRMPIALPSSFPTPAPTMPANCSTPSSPPTPTMLSPMRPKASSRSASTTSTPRATPTSRPLRFTPPAFSPGTTPQRSPSAPATTMTPASKPNSKQSLQLNPSFAPANDALASYYAMHQVTSTKHFASASSPSPLSPTTSITGSTTPAFICSATNSP